ncbi:MAG: adenine deaminase C-terminal domain-containing protein, partial [Oscillospiraceae bacterium]
SSGISDDHECVDTEELLARLRVGMKVLIREGSTERNLDRLITGAIENHCPLEHLAFCTDDKHPGEIRQEGHINYNVRRAIQLGLAPMEAVKLATINAAKHFRLEDEIGSLTPGRLADILLVPDLAEMEPDLVFFEGELVAENGRLTHDCPVPEYPAWICDTVHLKNPITAESFRLPAKTKADTAEVTVIGLIDLQIINNRLEEVLPVRDGCICPDPSRDILKLAVAERYGKNGGVGVGFVKGFSLREGALAYSTSHDHHNIVTVGAEDSDLAAAVNEVARLHGGLAVVRNGQVLASMELPIGGLMSRNNAEEVMEQVDVMNAAARQLGCPMSAPFMTLSFISLPTVPQLGLTDMGLVDVMEHKLIDVEH